MYTQFGILGYCSNIHPGEIWEEHFQELQNNVPKIKALVSPKQSFGLGLRIANLASIELFENPLKLQELKNWLQKEDVFVYTLNGFPFGGFHKEIVKDQVHTPDWTTFERLEYSKRLAQILVQILPETLQTAGLSTSPLSYKFWWNADSIQSAFEKSNKHILDLVDFLVDLKSKTGKSIHLDIEPEPDGLLGNHKEFVEWFENLVVENPEKELQIREHIQICFDVCHYAVSFDSIEDSLKELKEKGIGIGKIQISSALRVDLGEQKDEKLVALKAYEEPIYLHQVRAKNSSDKIIEFGDLSEALIPLKEDFKEARIHFHIPIFLDNFGLIDSTQEEIRKSIQVQKLHAYTEQLEIETYTWGVLPKELQKPMEESIAREIDWVLKQL